MDKRISKLSEIINESEHELLEKVDELKNSGKECDCDDCVVYHYIYDGDFHIGPEVNAVCLNCGGYIEV
jgi:hypothetical protein